MRAKLEAIRGVVVGLRAREEHAQAAAFGLSETKGRLVELRGAHLTPAIRLVLDAQREGEPVAWLGPRETSFFPPDAAEAGVDLDALAVVHVPREAAPRAADQLARSGAFGLIVLDVGRAPVAQALQSRLLGLAQKHDTAIVFLTCSGSGDAQSLGSLVSLRGEGRAVRRASGEFVFSVRVLKDKRRAPGWTTYEVCRGPAGLR